MAAVRSLYRRALRVADLCTEEHRAWASSYVRMRFRDDALARGGGANTMARRLTEAEDELLRMIKTLQHAGRIDSQDAERILQSQEPSGESAEKKSAPSGTAREPYLPASASTTPPYDWDLNAVGAWLQGLGLGHVAPAFARCHVDGALLLRLDDEDLADDLGVASRLERKRILLELERLRADSIK